MKTEEIVKAIIKEQSQIIGETLAITVAHSSGVVYSSPHTVEDLHITNPDGNFVLESIVTSYERLFGKASVEVCRNVIKRYMSGN